MNSANLGLGSKCEELRVSTTSPVYPLKADIRADMDLRRCVLVAVVPLLQFGSVVAILTEFREQLF